MKIFKKIFNPDKLSTFLFHISILTFIIAFNFAHNPPGGWYQQFLPNLNGRGISDMTFLDSLTGFACTPYVPNDSAFIIKTTNGGDNWFIIRRQPTNIDGGFKRIHFINYNTGYAGRNFLFKTTNAGVNWFQINIPEIFDDMFVLNEDTIWITQGGITGGLHRTTNGGQNWQAQSPGPGGNPEKIYMYDRNIGFITTSAYFSKTTNSGMSWTLIPGEGPFGDIYFADSLTGWKSLGQIFKKTTNGGLNWITLPLPPMGTPVIYNGIIVLSVVNRFSNINKDTIWGVGSDAFFGSGRYRGLIYKSTNGGNIWGYQLPDTSINIPFYLYCDFANKLNGWAYHLYSGVHTVNGGNDTTYFTGIKQVPNYVPENFSLGQNYPNPFNPITSIPFELKESSFVRLSVYDIKGTIIKELVNGGWSTSKYVSEFDGTNLSSGVYFYKIEITGDNSNKRFTETKRMVLLK